MAKKKHKWIGKTLIALAFVGALNWGFVEWFNFNLVNTIFGTLGFLEMIVYSIVAVGGAYGLYQVFTKK